MHINSLAIKKAALITVAQFVTVTFIIAILVRLYPYGGTPEDALVPFILHGILCIPGNLIVIPLYIKFQPKISELYIIVFSYILNFILYYSICNTSEDKS